MDLSGLSNLLPMPWSLILGIVIPIVLSYLGVKLPNLKTPAPVPVPSPVDPVPAPVPTPTIPDRPILNGLLALLALLRQVKPADLPPEERALVAALVDELKK